MRPQVTKQRTVMGIPVGPRQTDWTQVGKLAAMGLGALSTAAGGVGAKAVGSRLKDKVSGGAQAARDTATGTVAKLGQAVSPGTGGSEPDGERSGGDENLKKLRWIVKESVDVGVPVEMAYNQWTQFTDLPSIMGGVQGVEQHGDEETRWTVKIGPSSRSWTARILEQIPDERIVWESTDGSETRGAVTFHCLDRTLTRIHVEMEYLPHGVIEKIGNTFLAARRRTRKDLRLFKHYLELAGSETGEWRGEIPGDEEEQEEQQQPEEELAG